MSFHVLTPLAITHQTRRRCRCDTSSISWHRLPKPQSQAVQNYSCLSHKDPTYFPATVNLKWWWCITTSRSLYGPNKPRTMGALFTTGGFYVKLGYLIRETILEAKFLRTSDGLKTWVNLPCGCCPRSPDYIITTEKTREAVKRALWSPLDLNCCHTTGLFLLPTFLSIATWHFTTMTCCFTLEPVPMDNQFYYG